jgi:hypothetical protein
MSANTTEFVSKLDSQRLKRNEYAKQYRIRNKSDVIDDASEERRIALNLKAKFYRDRKKKIKEAATIEILPAKLKFCDVSLNVIFGFTKVMESHTHFILVFIATTILIVYLFVTCPHAPASPVSRTFFS